MTFHTVSQASGSESPTIAPVQSRYPGSPPFQDDDVSRIMFFGRSAEVEALFHKILVEDLVVLYSRSGLGKTSLLNAGILKPLRERGYLPLICRVYVGDEVQPLGPLESIYVSIEQGIEKALENHIIGEYHEGKKTTLWEYFKTLEIWSPDDILLTPVLILDQFEELFKFYERDKRQAFSEQLGDLVRGSIPKSLRDQYLKPSVGKTVFPFSETPPKVKILISLREEYLGRLAELSQDLPSIRKSEFRLTPLQRENAERAIVGPAEVDESHIARAVQNDKLWKGMTEPFSYDADKLNEILNFLSNPKESPEGIEPNEVDPTQLQILCQYIEEKVGKIQAQKSDEKVVVDDKLLPGDKEMREAIQNFYDRAIGKIPQKSERRKVIALIENGLISREDRRLSLAQADIQYRFQVFPKTLQELAEGRLLRPEYRLGDTYYELSHDTLIKPIQQSKKNRQRKKKNIIFLVLSVGFVCLAISTLYPLYLTTSQLTNTEVKINVLQSEVDNLKQEKQNLGQIIQVTASSLTERARQFQAKGEYQNALPLFQQALIINEKALGPESPVTVNSKNELALTYLALKEYQDALPLLEEVFRFRKNTLGPESLEALASMDHLALTYLATKDYQRALPLFEEAYKIKQKTLGPDSPDTANSLNNLVILYQDMGNHDKAQLLIQHDKVSRILRKYFFLLNDKKVDEAMKYWAGNKVKKEMLENMASGADSYQLKKLNFNSFDSKKNLVQARIDLIQERSKRPPFNLSGTIFLKKENNDWKITEIEFDFFRKWRVEWWGKRYPKTPYVGMLLIDKKLNNKTYTGSLSIKTPYLKKEVTQDAIINIIDSKVTITCENPDQGNYPADTFFLDLSWNTMKGYDKDVEGNVVYGVIFTAVTDEN